jgi:hypothetical protein
MPHFHDTTGRRWTIDITFDTLRRVKAECEINLAELVGDGQGQATQLTRLGGDVVLLIDTIYVIVQPQADALDVTDEDFGRALGGDAIAAAATAFWESLADFSRSLGKTDQARAIEKQTEIIRAATEATTEAIDRLDAAAEVRRALGDSGSSSPASSASTPAPSPSASSSG